MSQTLNHPVSIIMSETLNHPVSIIDNNGDYSKEAKKLVLAMQRLHEESLAQQQQ